MSYCGAPGNKVPCCQVESVVSVDERGQMILPKEVRDRAGIKAGDKMALVSCGENEGIVCLALIRADKLSAMVKQMLGPVFQDLEKGKIK